MTRYQSFSESVPLDCRLFSLPPTLKMGWDGQSGLDLGISLLPGQVGSDNTGSSCVWALLRRTEYSRVFQNGCFPLPLPGARGDFSQYFLWEPGCAPGGKSHNTVERASGAPGVFNAELSTVGCSNSWVTVQVFLLALVPVTVMCLWEAACPSVCLSLQSWGQWIALCLPSVTDERRIIDFSACSAFCSLLSIQQGER